MSAMDATTKGTILRSLVKFVQSELSPQQQAAAYAALPAEDRHIVEQRTILASEKISEFTLNRLTVEAAKAKGEPLEAFGRRAGRAELADAIGVYRFITMVLTPAALLKKASTLWGTIHSHGQLLVDDQTPGSARIHLTGFPSEPAHCARLTGWFLGAGEMTGAKNLHIVHNVCVCHGGTECQWQFSWK